MSKLVLLVVVAGLFIAPSTANNVNNEQRGYFHKLNYANTKLTAQLLYQQFHAQRHSTFATSALPSVVLGGVLVPYLKGQALAGTLKLLNLDDATQIEEPLREILDIANADTQVKSKLESITYSGKDIMFRKKFLSDLSNVNGEIIKIDTSYPDRAAKTMNHWMQCVDPDKEDVNVISPQEIHDDNSLFAFSHQLYQADWGSPFNPQGMENINFHINNDRSVVMPALVGNGYLKYTSSKELNCKIVEFPQKDENYSIVILLPDEIEGLLPLVEKIVKDPDSLNKGYKSMKRQCVNSTVPLGKVKSKTDMKKHLLKLNYSTIFEKCKSDLDGIATKAKNLYISSYVHAIDIIGNKQVAEEPTKNSPPPSDMCCDKSSRTEIICDHSFIYFVGGKSKNNDFVILIGGLYFGDSK